MRQLIQGVHQFRSSVYSSQRELFSRLASGQNPSALVITCSDSRVDPGLITQAGPGELFVLRNAGNMVPPYGASNGGEGPSIEFAVSCLGVRDIVICGHTKCGVIHAMTNPEAINGLPQLNAWMQNAEATRRIMDENYAEYGGDERLSIATQEHVLVQIENLQTHPVVAARLHRGELALHGWVYKLETGQVFAYCTERNRFVPIEDITLPESRQATVQKAM